MEERPFSTPGKRTSMADLDLEVSLVDPAGQATLERCDFETERDLEEIEIRPDNGVNCEVPPNHGKVYKQEGT